MNLPRSAISNNFFSADSMICSALISDFYFEIHTSDLIDVHNFNSIQFCYDHRKKLNKYSDTIKLTKEANMPGWFTVENI